MDVGPLFLRLSFFAARLMKHTALFARQGGLFTSVYRATGAQLAHCTSISLVQGSIGGLGGLLCGAEQAASVFANVEQVKWLCAGLLYAGDEPQ